MTPSSISIFSVPPLVAVLLFTVLGLFIFLKNRRTSEGKLFLVICFLTIWWQASWFVLFNLTSQNASLIEFLIKFGHVGIIFIPIVFYHFILVITAQHEKGSVNLLLLRLGYALSSVFVFVLIGSDYIINGYNIFSWGVYPKAGSYHFVYLAYLVTISCWIIYLLTQSVRTSKAKGEDQLHKRTRTLLIGVIFYVLSSIDFLTNYGLNIYPLGIILITIFLGFVVYAIVWYRLLDVKTFAAQVFAIFISIVVFLEIFTSSSALEYLLRVVFFLIVVIAAYFIVKSVQQEINQKEKLEQLTAKLGRANAELQKLDKAKSEFISIASHQLRTPLTAVKGYLSLIKEGSYGSVSEQVDKTLDKISMASEQLIQLVEDLLNTSRIEAGRMQYNFTEVNVVDVIKLLDSNFSLRTESKSLEFKVSMPEEPVMIQADLTKIREVFSNVIDNAIKYTEEGYVHVTLSTDNENMIFVVNDSGIGIPSHVMPTLFQKFSRGKDQSRLHVNGTGLGLFVVKNVLDAHKGVVTIESDGAGEGSTFTITMPLLRD